MLSLRRLPMRTVCNVLPGTHSVRFIARNKKKMSKKIKKSVEKCDEKKKLINQTPTPSFFMLHRLIAFHLIHNQ